MTTRAFRYPSLVLIGLVASAAVTFAAPFHYDESTSGDLNDFISGDFVGTADTGLNTVTGALAVNDGGDSAGFTIPAGLEVSSIQLTITNFTGTGTGRARLFSDSGSTRLTFQDFSTNGVFTFVPVPVPPLSAGNYVIEVTGLAPGITYSYNWSVVGEPVPEPSSSLLLIAGLLGSAGIGVGWRRKNRKA